MEKNNTNQERKYVFHLPNFNITKDAKFLKKDSFENVVDTSIFTRTER